MERQESKDKSEQAASDKAVEQQAERLADIERPSHKPPKSKVFPIFNAYVILVGTVIGFGVLAFYTGHKFTADVIFYLSIPLLALIPLALVIYLLPMIREQLTAITDRIADSRLFAFTMRHIAKVAYTAYAVSLYQVVEGIRMFPNRQRGGLMLIAVGTYNFITWRELVLEVTLRRRINKLRDRLDNVSEIAIYLFKENKMRLEREPKGEKRN
jgi:hypothetical protein